MGKIVSLSEYKEENTPHAGGECVCLACNHSWMGVAPIPINGELQCPSCKTYRGVFKYNVAPSEDTLIFECNCGCDNFFVTTLGVFCVGCGNTIPFEDLCE